MLVQYMTRDTAVLIRLDMSGTGFIEMDGVKIELSEKSIEFRHSEEILLILNGFHDRKIRFKERTLKQ